MKRIFSIAGWQAIAALGAGALGSIALHRGEPLNATWFVVAAVCCYLVAYRLYSAFVAAKVLALDDTRATPCERHDDGRDFVPTNKWVLFGHHFAAIAGPGPLVGPTLAAQFGYLPGTLWLIAGCAFAGCVQDFIILFCSIRRNGKTLGEMARDEVSKRGGIIAQIAVLAIMVILLGVVALVIVNALKSSPWATFTLAMTIPIALLLGLYLRYLRPGRVLEASLIGVALVMFAVVAGQWVAESPNWAHAFTFGGVALAFILMAYGFAASALPVWLLLAPRDYLSAFIKAGAIFSLAAGILIVRPEVHMPALTKFVDGSGPVFAGKVFPFCFITIACGAISGFHSLVSSGTTPKMLDRESDARMIGYGAMLCEGFVGVMAFIAVLSLAPADYFAINATPEKFATLGMQVEQLPELSREVGENVAGRTGGAVSLAVGMAHIFSNIPGLRGLMAYWYHFAIMFEALFILTTIDAGTRVARFLLQEFLGKFYRPMERTGWLPGAAISSFLIVGAWGYFIHTGTISTIWPMFGIANQLLAAMALSIGTTVIIRSGRPRYAWVTLLPLAFVATTTLTAGWLSITDIFLPMARQAAAAAVRFQGYLNAGLTAVMMTCIVLTIGNCVLAWIGHLGARAPAPAAIDN